MTTKAMPAKHVPEPWRVAPASDYADNAQLHVDAGLNGFVGLMGMRGDAAAEANARRIVACVNGCAGLADPSAVPELLAAARLALQELNDQLDGRRHCGDPEYECPMQDVTKSWSDHQKARELLTSALAKATGTDTGGR